MQLKKISKTEFNQLDNTRKMIINDHAQVFAVIDLGTPLGQYGLSWRSELIEPNIQCLRCQQICWVGVDQKLAAIDLKSGAWFKSLNIRVTLLN
jgi:hypothetical protein